MNNENPITIDLSYLEMVSGGDKEFGKQLLEDAIDDIDIKVSCLEKAYQAQDAKTICNNTHSLKSLSAIAGVSQMETWSISANKLFADGIFHSKTPDSVINIIRSWALTKTKLQQMLIAY